VIKASKLTEYFTQLFLAHETIAGINDKIKELYRTAELIETVDPKTYEDSIKRADEFRELSMSILQARASFDLFDVKLPAVQRRVLKLRCEECLTWKEISADLGSSIVTARRYFTLICEKAINSDAKFMEKYNS
jgi:DNA-directed RNA polymerase specialized sigma24 family protein